MRFLSSWPQYLATADEGGVQIHQFATGELRATMAGETVRIATETGYPWDGRIRVTVLEAPETPGPCRSGCPAGVERRACRIRQAMACRSMDGTRRVDDRRVWRSGDAMTLMLDLPVRVTSPDPHVDASRGCVALERGPLVYCIETADLPDGLALEEVELDPAAKPVPVASTRSGPRGRRPCRPRVASEARDPSRSGPSRTSTWANRTVEAMRIWIPRASPSATADDGR